jgi:hypothetical protein
MTSFDEYQNLPDLDEEISWSPVDGWLADGEPINQEES